MHLLLRVFVLGRKRRRRAAHEVLDPHEVLLDPVACDLLVEVAARFVRRGRARRRIWLLRRSGALLVRPRGTRTRGVEAVSRFSSLLPWLRSAFFLRGVLAELAALFVRHGRRIQRRAALEVHEVFNPHEVLLDPVACDLLVEVAARFVRHGCARRRIPLFCRRSRAMARTTRSTRTRGGGTISFLSSFLPGLRSAFFLRGFLVHVARDVVVLAELAELDAHFVRQGRRIQLQMRSSSAMARPPSTHTRGGGTIFSSFLPLRSAISLRVVLAPCALARGRECRNLYHAFFSSSDGSEREEKREEDADAAREQTTRRAGAPPASCRHHLPFERFKACLVAPAMGGGGLEGGKLGNGSCMWRRLSRAVSGIYISVVESTRAS
jgi:hypothetical protein